jgi:hypothetical protein
MVIRLLSSTEEEPKMELGVGKSKVGYARQLDERFFISIGKIGDMED